MPQTALALVVLLSIQAFLIAVLLVERSRRNRASDSLQAAAKVFDTTGSEFFRTLTEHLNSALQVDYVSIGELSSDGSRIKTVAVSADGRNLENLEYEVDQTPCQKVLELGHYFDPGEVQSHFPLDGFLVEMGFRSYLGVALKDSAGQRLGVMSVLSRQPLKDTRIAELTLSLFAARCSLEIEHRRSALELEKSNSFFQKIARTMPGVLFVYDLVLRRNVYVNQGGWGVLGYTDDEVLAMGDTFLGRIMHPDDLATLPKLAEQYARASDGEVFKHQFRMRHKNGEWRWVHRLATIFTRTPDGRPQQLVGSATDITDLKRAENDLRHLSSRLLDAQDQERRRIARELHDGTAQNIFAIRLNLALLERLGTSPAVVKIVAECQNLCDKSLQELRTLSYLLHPPMLDQGGLISAVRWFVEGFAKRSSLKVDLQLPEEMERLPVALERDLFLMVQECLSNVVRHSASGASVVCLDCKPDEVILKVQDFGRGMPDKAALEKVGEQAYAGVGIPSMRERLRQIGGRLEIRSSDQGTTVIATVPLPLEGADDGPDNYSSSSSTGDIGQTA